MKVYHIVYKTINLVNNKFYIGVHKSSKLMDEYLGSGKLISLSIKKYGRENFIRENLFIYPDARSAYGKEQELLSVFLEHPLCMNLKQGGMGGFDLINTLPRTWGSFDKARLVLSRMYQEDKEFRKMMGDKVRNRFLDIEYRKRVAPRHWIGKNHSESSKNKISISMQGRYDGCNNPSYGTCWITKNSKNKKIKKDELEFWLDQGWSLGRTLKNKS